MSEHHYIERTDSGSGVATGMVLAIIAVLLVGVVVLFMFFGGPGRFMGGATTAPPSNTNINVPPQTAPQQGGPQINVPPRVDVNVNPGQGSSGSNGSNSGSGQQAPSNQGSSSSGSGSGR
jgi:hypothetical protein